MRIIYVDIDETICNRESSVDFGITHDTLRLNLLRRI